VDLIGSASIARFLSARASEIVTGTTERYRCRGLVVWRGSARPCRDEPIRHKAVRKWHAEDHVARIRLALQIARVPAGRTSSLGLRRASKAPPRGFTATPAGWRRNSANGVGVLAAMAQLACSSGTRSRRRAASRIRRETMKGWARNSAPLLRVAAAMRRLGLVKGGRIGRAYGSRQCRAKSKRSGQRCRNWALKGLVTCKFHGALGGPFGGPQARPSSSCSPSANPRR
jgi:hypothetical protein